MLFPLLFLLFITACNSRVPPKPKKPLVLISIPPYEYFVRKIAAEEVDISCLTPPGTNPHLFEVPPKLAEEALSSSLWLRVGDPGEKKFLTILSRKSQKTTVVDLSVGLELLPGHCHHMNPHCASHHHSDDFHTWLSPPMAKEQSKRIAQALIALSPENRGLYENNLALLLEELDILDTQLRDALSSQQGETILVSHPALGYFCHEYGLKQLAVEVDGKEPLPMQIASLLETARSEKVHMVFLQPQHNNQGALRVAEKLELPVETIDPYTANYVEGLLRIAHLIADHS